MRNLSKSEIKELSQKLLNQYGKELLSKKDLVQEIKNSEYIVYKVNGTIAFVEKEDIILPTLKFILKNNFLPKIIVDMGAVKFVASGADVMRPGIKQIPENLPQHSTICIVDEKNNMALAIGSMLYKSEDMQIMTSGKCIKNLHYVGDEIWKIE